MTHKPTYDKYCKLLYQQSAVRTIVNKPDICFLPDATNTLMAIWRSRCIQHCSFHWVEDQAAGSTLQPPEETFI